MWAGTQRKCHATIIGDKFEVIGKNCRFLHTIHIKLRRKPSATAPSKVQQYLGDREGDVVSEVAAKIPELKENVRIRFQDRQGQFGK